MLDQRWRDTEFVGFYVLQGMSEAAQLRLDMIRTYTDRFVQLITLGQVTSRAVTCI